MENEHRNSAGFLALTGASLGLIAFLTEQWGYIDKFTRSVEYFSAGHMSGFYSSLIVLCCGLSGGCLCVYAAARGSLSLGFLGMTANLVIVAYHGLALLINY